MTADALLSRLERVKRTGRDRWTCRCPAHKDRTASLSVRELDDGRVLVHCFAGCEVAAVLSAAGMDFEALFPPRALSQHGAPAEKRPFSSRELLDALASELHVVWVLLSDMHAGVAIQDAHRKRAGVARDRCVALIEELRLVR